MSTKAIREALNELEEWRKDHGHDKGISVEAHAEVEAIERAAKEFSDPAQGMSAASMNLLEQIASDAP